MPYSLPSCLQTAGLPRSIIKTNDLLKERSFGSLEGTPWHSSTSVALLDDDLPDGVEPWSHLMKRANEAISFIERKPANNILIVAHGSIGRAMRKVVEPESDIHASFPNTELVRWI